MTDKVNEHLFNFKLPMFPNQRIQDNSLPCVLEMDGKQMKGVTGGHLRFGSNGFTNVVIEFEASCAAEFAGHLVAHMDFGHMECQDVLGGIYDEVVSELGLLDDFAHSLDGCDKADLVKRIIELTIERIK